MSNMKPEFLSKCSNFSEVTVTIRLKNLPNGKYPVSLAYQFGYPWKLYWWLKANMIAQHPAAYLQFNGFVPVDDVTWELKGLNVDNVHIATLRTHVQPLALKRQVTIGYPENIPTSHCCVSLQVQYCMQYCIYYLWKPQILSTPKMLAIHLI